MTPFSNSSDAAAQSIDSTLTPASDSAIQPDRTAPQSIVFIDANVSDYELLRAGVVAGVEVVVLNPEQDGVAQIAAQLSAHPQVTTVSLVAHGVPGCLYLGNTELSLSTIDRYAHYLQTWNVRSLSLYSCNVAVGDAGSEFLAKLQSLTQATIAASSTPIGAQALGGNWQLDVRLEQSIGLDDSTMDLVFQPAVLTAYPAILANVGYYDMSAGAGVASQVASITAAGHTPILLNDVDAASLVGIDVLVVQNPNNFAYGAEYLSRLADIQAAVNNGMVLVIHDRYVDPAESILPGMPGNPIIRSLGNNINVQNATTLVTNGPGGVVNDTNLDGGGSSTHGFANAAGLPPGTTVILNNGTPDQAVTFSYQFGQGFVIYSAIPLDFHLISGDPDFRNIYAPNVIAYAASLENQAPVLADTVVTLNAVSEDAPVPSGVVGTPISQLVDFIGGGGQNNVTDADSSATGIAITAADTTNGTWFFSTDDGTTWTALGAVANNNARLLAATATTRLYFQPNTNYTGSIANAITFRAWDRTTGTNGSLADTSINGGSTAFSTATDTASIAVNTDPSVTGVAVPTNGTYGTGQPLDFIVSFDQAVTVVGGMPSLPVTLNTGGTVNATYVSGSGTNLLRFRYTVTTGTADPDGITVGNAIDLNGSTIQNSTLQNADLTLNNVPSTASILVEAIAPTVVSIIPSVPLINDSTFEGGTFSMRVIFSEPMDTSVAPTISFPTVGENPASTITLDTGSSSWFNPTTYRAFFGVDDNNLTLPNVDVQVTGARDVAGNLQTPATVANVFDIDTENPTVTGVTLPANGVYTSGQTLTFTVTFSDAIDVTASGTDIPRIPITLNTGGTVYANYTAGTGSNTLTFTYTVQSTDLDLDGITVGNAIDLNNGSLEGRFDDNNAVLALTGLGSTSGILIEGALPVVNLSTVTPNRNEGGTAIVTAQLSRPTTQAVTIPLTFTGTATSGDYTPNTGTITIPVGSTTASFVFDVTADSTAEPVETIDIGFGTITGATAGTTTQVSIAANDFVVTNTNDSGEGSLRQAILNINASASGGTITFAIPAAGVQTITLLSPLPAIARPVNINGYSQTGASRNTQSIGSDATLLIALNGNRPTVTGNFGLVLDPGSDGSTIQGLILNGFDQSAIRINSGNTHRIQGNFIGTNATGTAAATQNFTGIVIFGGDDALIGGTTVGDRNIISGNNRGIRILGGAGSHDIIGNYVGTTAAGTGAIANASIGIEIGTGGHVVRNNLVAGNGSDGIYIAGNGSTVAGNLIGTTALGTAALANGNSGIQIFGGNNNTIGGASIGDRNIISANGLEGIRVTSSAADNRIQGNYIGTDITGNADLGNIDSGILVSSTASNTLIGGMASGEGNVISGNNNHGIGLFQAGVTGTQILGNRIGTNAAGTAALGNTGSGILVNGANNSIIGGTVAGAGNTIANNAAGVTFANAGAGSEPNGNQVVGNTITANTIAGILGVVGTSNRFSQNSIANNTGLGIDLNNNGVTLNDAGDGDAGANALQNFPVLTSATVTGTTTAIAINLNSTPSTTFSIELYSNDVLNAGNNYGEGATFLGTASITTDASGNGTVTFNQPTDLTGRWITATATNTTTQNTSEFSAAITTSIANQAPVLDNSGTPSFTAIDEDILSPANLGMTVRDLIRQVNITDVNGDPEAIAITNATSAIGTWQYSTNGTTWTNITTTGDNNATVLGATTYYSANLGTAPNSQTWLSYTAVNIPIIPPLPGIPTPASNTETVSTSGAIVNTTANQRMYAGYSNYNISGTKVNAASPLLDHTKGYSVSFDLQVLADAQTNVDRAGFSVLLVSEDATQAIELAFQRLTPTTGRIFAQGLGFVAAESIAFNVNAKTDYRIEVKDNTYRLFANEVQILTGSLRDYVFSPPANFTFNPYERSSLIFLGDNSTSAQGTFNLSQVVVQTETRVRFQPNADANATADLTFRAWDTTNGVSTGAIVDASTNGGATVYSSASETATITINAVNDKPNFVKGADQTISAGSPLQTVTGWATGFDAGPADEDASQAVLRYEIVSIDKPGLFATLPSIATDGTLTYQPIAGLAAIDTATITVRVQDNGGTARGGVDLSDLQTFTIAVVPQTVSLTATDTAAAEGATDTGSYRLARNTAVGDLTVEIDITGTAIATSDYAITTSAGTATITGNKLFVTMPAGSAIVDLTLTATVDNRAESTETAILTLPASPLYIQGASTTGTVSIAPNEFVVTNTNDSGEGSLRQAIINANALGDGTNPSTIRFAIPGAGPHTIAIASNLAPITKPVIIDGYTQPGASANTLAVGNNAVLQVTVRSAGTGLADAFILQTSNSTIRGLNLRNLQRGVTILGTTSTNNVIEGNFIGTDITGTSVTGTGNNFTGISVFNGSGNRVGGTTPASRNIISGSGIYGLEFADTGANNNIAQGNYIGTDASGTLDLSNFTSGVFIRNGVNNQVFNNLISGNIQAGVQIQGSTSTGNQVRGNLIGTNATGTAAIANSIGILLEQGSGNTIGGTTAVDRNIISGNTNFGIILASGVNNTTITGNYIGTDSTGAVALGNGGAGIQATSNTNTIGGTAAGAGNVISGNTGNGLLLTGTNNTVQGNRIGTNAAGTAALGNTGVGIQVISTGNVIGGTATAAGNVVSGNQGDGIQLTGSNNTVQGNRIGTDVTGTAAIGNGGDGMQVSSNNTIGGTIAGAGNVVSGNQGDGMQVNGNNNTIQGNAIGTNASGTALLGNIGDGIFLVGSNNAIGGTTADAANRIAGNGGDGVATFQPPAGGITTQTTYTYTGAPVALPDLSTVNIPLNITDQGLIGDLEVRINLTHTFTADLDIFLISPDGTIVELSTDNGSGGDNFINTVFDDQAGTAITAGTAPFTGTFRPEGGLSTLNGESINGTWTLRVIDDAGGDSGSLSSWDMTITPRTATGNQIRGNQIYSNTGLGIDLGGDGLTANDAGDNDVGPNNLQNFPVLTGASNDGSTTTIGGSFNGAANTTYTLEFFSNTAIDTPNGEGQTPIGTATVTTDATGNAALSIALPTIIPVGQFITATATDATNNTSEFSNGVAVVTTVPPLAIVINEVAWMGTTANAIDEWIELYNPGTSAIDLSNWQLLASDGTPLITFPTGTVISPRTYFLMEQGSDDTIDDITADLIYTGSLGTTGDTLTLKASDGRVIDTANGNGGAWSAGTNNSAIGRFSMERISPIDADADDQWQSNDGFTINGEDRDGNDIYGTPRAPNSAGVQPTISITDQTVTEGDTGSVTASVTVSLSHPSPNPITVDYATTDWDAIAPDDYTALPTTTLTFAPGETTQTIDVAVQGDLLNEFDEETFTVDLSAPTNATIDDAQGEVTIADNDALPTISIADLAITEGDTATTATFTVTLSAASGKTITVDYATVSGTALAPDDFAAIPTTTLTFNPGVTTQTVTVSIVGDLLDEIDPEPFTIDLSNAVNATIADGQAIGSIADNDPTPTVAFTTAAQSGDEGTIVTITAALSAVSGLDVTVPFTITGTATNGLDFTITTSPIAIAAGDPDATITVVLSDDLLDEAAETIIVTMGAPTNATQGTTIEHTVTITDTDPSPEVSLAISGTPLAENGGVATVTAILSAISGQDVTIDLDFTDGTGIVPADYTASATQIIIPAGSTTGSITITGVDDAIDELSETITIDIDTITNGTENGIQQVIATIADDEPLVTVDFTAAAQTNDESTTTVTIQVQLSGESSRDVTVPFTLSGTAIDGTDYTITTSPVTIAAGSTTADITITVDDDALDEIDEAIVVTMGTPINADLGTTTVHTVTITDNDAPPEVTLSIIDTPLDEDAGSASVTATLSAVSGQDVVVELDFTNGSTAEFADYTVSDLQLIIPAGQLSSTLSIDGVDDAIDEADETVVVDIFSVTNGIEATPQSVTATIVDDDAPPEVFFNTTAQSSDEGTTVTITAQLSTLSEQEVTVPFTLTGTAAGMDYALTTPNPIIIPAGSLTGTISIDLTDDALNEAPETVIVTMDTAALVNATAGATTVHTLSITDNDLLPDVTLSIADSPLAENGGVATVTATLSAISGQEVTIDLSALTTANPSDYLLSGLQIVIPAGSTTGNITITGVDDAIDEFDEEVSFSIVNLTNATAAFQTVTATITDDDATPTVTFTSAAQPIAEGTVPITITAQLSAASGLDVTVPFTLTGTAIDGSDYVLITFPLTIAAGDTTADITLDLIDDLLNEVSEEIIVTMGVPTNATAGATTVHTVTITDNDPEPTVSLAIAGSTVAENAGQATVTATLSAESSRDVTIDLGFTGTATTTTDYTTSATQIVIPAGSTSGSITLTGVTDAIDEVDETIIVDITNVTNGTEDAVQQVTATIADDDLPPSIAFTTATQTRAEGSAVTVTAQLSAASTLEVTVPLTLTGTAIDGTDYTLAPTSITIPAGSTTADLTLTLTDDPRLEPSETVIITMGVPTNASLGAIPSQTITITDNDIPPAIAFTTATQTIAENGGTVTITAQLSSSTDLDVTVPLTLTSPTYTIPLAPITIAAGTTTATVSVAIVDDSLDELDETLVVTMGTPVNATLGSPTTHTITVTDDDTPPSVTLSIANSPFSETGGSATITATLSAITAQPVTVNLGYTGTAATSDYTTSAPSIIIPAGSLTGTLTLSSTSDAIDEADETIIVDLLSVTNATEDTPQQVTATITDDDPIPTVNFVPTSQTVSEEAGTITLTAELSNPSSQDITVPLTLSGTATSGTDYTAIATPSISIAAGQTRGTLTVALLGDSLDEDNETLIATLGTPTNATAGTDTTTTITISDTDPEPTLSIEDITVTEGDTDVEATFRVRLSTASAKPISVDYAIVAGTAQSIADYRPFQPARLNFAPGETEQLIRVTVLGDRFNEATETFQISLSNPTNATFLDPQAIGTIRDNDPLPTLSISDATVVEGNNGATTATLTLTLDQASSQPVTVTYNTVDGTATAAGQDYLAVAATALTFAPGETSKTINLAVLGDLQIEPAETFTVQLSNPQNVLIPDNSATITLTTDDTDRLRGEPGDGENPDTCAPGIIRRGNRRDNRLNGTEGSDRLFGNGGRDTLRGRGCNDFLNGGIANDRLFGDTGNDSLLGGAGRDQLSGGTGRDRFIYNSIREGGDLITDFNIREDRLDFSRIFTANRLDRSRPNDYIRKIQIGSRTAIAISPTGFTNAFDPGRAVLNSIVILQNVRANQLTDSNFIV